jgi:hypothetical protein
MEKKRRRKRQIKIIEKYSDILFLEVLISILGSESGCPN